MNGILADAEKRYRAPYNGSLALSKVEALEDGKKPLAASRLRPELEVVAQKIGELQEMLYADASKALLLVFQGVDAAGKDSTIHKVFSRADPVGCQVSSFKVPYGEEIQHDFLWRCTQRLPRFGEIGLFNRSYYEAVLTERVHPEVLINQRKKDDATLSRLWQSRYRSIREYERHLTANGTVILKFWLYVSKQRQASRLLKRIDKPEKRWKFSAMDVYDRDHWDDYMQAYVDAVNATSRAWAPWYVIPADHKPTLQLAVARITLVALKGMNLAYPVMDEQARAQMEAMRCRLQEECKPEKSTK